MSLLFINFDFIWACVRACAQSLSFVCSFRFMWTQLNCVFLFACDLEFGIVLGISCAPMQALVSLALPLARSRLFIFFSLWLCCVSASKRECVCVFVSSIFPLHSIVANNCFGFLLLSIEKEKIWVLLHVLCWVLCACVEFKLLFIFQVSDIIENDRPKFRLPPFSCRLHFSLSRKHIVSIFYRWPTFCVFFVFLFLLSIALPFFLFRQNWKHDMLSV